MAIVTISRGSHSRGTEVAEKVAERLGYRCLARETLLRASGEYNIPELELVQAIEDPPSVIERLMRSKDRYIATIRATLLKEFAEDNIVYHGTAGHFFAQGITHALKVRILANETDRVADLVEREKIPDEEARQQLIKMDKNRRQWALYVYGIDPEDPALYDTVLHVGKMGTDGATEVICNLAQHGSFSTTAASQIALDNLSLSASVEAVLVDMEIALDTVNVTAENGKVVVQFKEARRTLGGTFGGFTEHYMDGLQVTMSERTGEIPGLKNLQLKSSTP